MRKRIIGAVLALAICASFSTGFAFGGIYPEHPQYAGLSEQKNLNRNSWSESDADYIFGVGGKKFILLDTDEEGNYFVLTDEFYGRKAFDTTYANSKSTIETATEDSKGKLTYTKGDAFNVDKNQVIFNPEDETNIAYWLNNDFLTAGNGAGNILPQPIQSNLVEKDWDVEGMNGAVLGWQAKQYYDDLKGQTTGADFAKSIVIEPYTVRSKVALMSATEYLTYQDVIGMVHDSDVWRGMMLRTPMFQLGGAKTTSKVTGKAIPQTLTLAWGNAMAKNNSNKADATQKKMVLAYNDTGHTSNMLVRPCFWLSKDFFKNVKLDLSVTGKNTREIMAELSVVDLLKLYSVEETKELKNGSDDVKINNLSMVGTPVIGSEIYADYSMVNEGVSEYCWMVSDTPDGEFSLLDTFERGLDITEDIEGKFVKCVIAPKNSSGKTGKLCISDAVGPVAKTQTVTVGDINVDRGNKKVTVTFVNPMQNEQKVRYLAGEYNEFGELINMTSETVTLAADEKTTKEFALLSATAQNNKTMSMIWADNNQPLLKIN